ncbi:MAG: hypothetical protein R2685_02445 [Candidatus Nitrosocosmicus sp.]|nr:hypothetical protein [Candidatus Nitrosocosmicus sp.]
MLSSSQQSEIIGHYLQGLTRDDIALITNASTGAVSNTIRKWKVSIQAPDLEEIRSFMKLLRKADMTLSECAEGFRTSKLMHKIGITVIGESDMHESKFFKFVNEFYKVCQAHHISPQILASWFDDLVDFTISNWYKGSSGQNNKDITQVNTKKEYSKMYESVPLTALISRHLERKKNELNILEKKKKEAMQEINLLKTQKERLDNDLTSKRQERNHFLSCYNSFTKLERVLKEHCNIDLKTDLKPVVNLFYGFMEQGYDLENILEVYNVVTDIESEIISKKNIVISLEEEISRLQNAKSGNQALLDASRKNWDTYSQLEEMKFGLEELKQLWLIITDIVKSRGIDPDDAVSVFIKDVEENYYEKLLFENRVIQKKKELEITNNQLILNRHILSAQPFVGTSMSQLYKNGITEQDIVELTRLFQSSLKQEEQQEKAKSEAYSHEISKINGWKALAEDLKKYDGIKEAVRRETINLNKLGDKYLMLIKDMKDLSYLYQTAFHLINLLNNSYSYFKGYFDQSQNKNIFNIIPGNILVPLIILVSHPSKNDKEEERD